MTFTSYGSLSATSTTSINDWRSFLDMPRTTSRWRGITLPLELRLILMTTAVVLTLVAAGAQIASVVEANAAHVGQQRHSLASSSTVADSWQPDGICYAASTLPAMISASTLAGAHTPGIREVQPGTFRTCQINGLLVPEPAAGVPSLGGQVILVSLSQGWLWAYQDGALVFANPVATGMPYLRTPRGTFHIWFKESNVTFYSPWPRSSPFYYSPEHITYALHFRYGGFYIHDAPWRQMFGPGAQDPHTTPSGAVESGSHGCVDMTTSAVAWLYNWVHLGATVQIVA
ncbi:MAG TPA: L,D-transpeptidase [Ktedonobacterales bacterium]|nr:L,D-transpeptidase [Ktedonobacterales bacterium]